MKKGLLSLLVVALTVVGCQDYDDQFDSLNKEIKSLQTDITTIKGLTAAVALISTDIKALEGKMVTDADITGILAKVAEVKTAVAAIDVSGIDDVKTQTADLNTEIDTILTKLTKLAAVTGGAYSGNINITSLAQLDAAEDIVDPSEEGPLMTITGNVNVTSQLGADATAKAANLIRVQAILNKFKVISGSVTITGADSLMSMDELLYITGSLDITGKDTFTLPKLNTVDGSVDFNLFGDLSYPILGSAGGGLILSGNTVSITTVDLSGLTIGVVTTAAGVLVLPKATSVKVGSFPASVTLAKATTVEAHGVAALANMSMSAPIATAVTIKAGSFAGTVTVSANLAAVTLDAKTIADQTQIHATSVSLDKLTAITSSLVVSQTAALFAPALFKTGGASITLIGATTASFPSMTSLTATFTGAKVTSFSAPLLVASGLNSIDVKGAGTTVSVKSLALATDIVDFATIAGLTLAAQGVDIVLDNMVALTTLNYTSSVIGGTLTASTTMVSLTTLTLGSSSKLTTLTVSATNMTALSTAGVILNTKIVNNAKLLTLGFDHTHLDGQNATTVDIINNDKLLSVNMSSLGKVKAVEVTGNASLTTFIAPSVTNKAEPTVTIVVTMTGNDITGTYSPTIAGTESSPEVPYTSSSAAIYSMKGFIDGYSSTQTVTFNLDIDRLLLGSSTDGKYNDGKYSAGTAHGSTITTTIELGKFTN